MPIHILKLKSKHEIARNTIALQFEKPAGFNFTPGQYGGFTLINPSETDAGGVTRRFSLLSSPLDDFIEIGTRVQQSAYKRVLSSLPVGGEIKFAGPTGNFVLHDDINTPAVMIAGGIGIAPFYSIIKCATQQKSPRRLILFYGNNTRQDAALLSELETMASENPNVSLIPVLAHPEADWQGETGYITHTLIKKYIPDISAPVYYVCGSPAMVTVLQETLTEMDIDAANIKVEDFPGY